MIPTLAFLDAPGPLAIAHRGGAGDWPENSMRAFEGAVDLGFRYVETDVHATSDGVVVAFHDDHLDRVTDRAGRIAELPWSEVRRARIDGTEPIPLLEDLLGTWPQLRINIDPKEDAVVEPLVAVIAKTAALDRVCIGAFSDHRIDRVRDALGDRLCTGLGPMATARLRTASFGVPVGHITGACAQVPTHAKGVPLVDMRFVTEAHDRGLDVHVWTIDEPDEMDRLLDLGVDGIMTDRPAVLRSVLQRRGQWFG